MINAKIASILTKNSNHTNKILLTKRQQARYLNSILTKISEEIAYDAKFGAIAISYIFTFPDDDQLQNQIIEQLKLSGYCTTLFSVVKVKKSLFHHYDLKTVNLKISWDEHDTESII